MTDEEKELVDYLFAKYYFAGQSIENEDIETFFTLIDKQQKEIEKYKRLAEINLNNEEEFRNNICEHRCLVKSDYEEQLAKKDKQIDLMCDYIDCLDLNVVSKDCSNCKECLKQYFEKEAENEKR